MAKRVLWVVEVLCPDVPRSGWYPTVGGWLTRDEARIGARDWRARNPCERFRVIPYQPKE